MNGEDVFGNKISVHYPDPQYDSRFFSSLPNDLVKDHAKEMIGTGSKLKHFTPFPPPPNPAKVAPPRLLSYRPYCVNGGNDLSSCYEEPSPEPVMCESFVIFTVKF